MSKSKSKILAGGVERVVHVFVPLMAAEGMPVWAIRSANHKFDRMMLVHSVKVHGPSESKMVDPPLSGTGGRGVALLTTTHAIEVGWEYPGDEPITINTLNAKPEDLAKQVVAMIELRDQTAKRRRGRKVAA